MFELFETPWEILVNVIKLLGPLWKVLELPVKKNLVP